MDIPCKNSRVIQEHTFKLTFMLRLVKLLIKGLMRVLEFVVMTAMLTVAEVVRIFVR